jgi:hypothetical protein
MAYVYTPKEFEEISLLWQNGQSLEVIQSLYPSKSIASIRMKLVKAGLYNRAQSSAVPAAPKKAAKPTTSSSVSKAQMLATYKHAEGKVGLAPW